MDGGSHSWCREGIDVPGGWPDGALAIGSTWSSQGYERHGCIDVPAVQAMPRSEEKSRLTERGIRSWLCVPLWYAGNRVGLLGLDAVEAEKHWADDDIALLRTIGEIFASALGRDAALTQRREAFDRLAASEARYRAVVDTQTEFIQRITPDGRLSFVSDAYCRYYGHPREELLGQIHNQFTLTVPEDRERDAAHLASLTPEHPSEMIELRRRLPDGSIRWVQWNDTAVFDAKGRLLEIQSVGRDVTERVAAEARFLAAAETLPDGLAIFDAEDRLVYHNRRYPEHQMANRARRPGARQAVRGPAARRPGAGPDPSPGHGRGLRGAPACDAPAGPQRARAAPGRRPLGAGARGQDAGWRAVLLTSDITRQRSLEAELRQAEKLKAVGTLASGIAHDFNNILATIFTSTEVALMQLPPDATVRAPLDRVMSAGRRGRQLVAEILTFSRSERTPRVAIDLGAAVAAAIDLCRPAMGERVEVALRAPHRADLRRRRRDPDPPDRQQSLPECGAGDAGRRHDRGPPRRRPGLGRGTACPAARARFGQRHGRGHGRPRVRALLHHQAGGPGHRPGPRRRPRHGQGAGRPDHAAHGTRAGAACSAISLPCITARQCGPARTDGRPPGRARPGRCSWSTPTTTAPRRSAMMLRASGHRVTRYAARRRRSRRTRPIDRRTSSWPTSPARLERARARRALRLLSPELAVILLAGAPASPEEQIAAKAMSASIIAKPVLRRELAAALAGPPTPAPKAAHRAAS